MGHFRLAIRAEVRKDQSLELAGLATDARHILSRALQQASDDRCAGLEFFRLYNLAL